ncbi:CapA family protein [Streptomyces sp. NPDC050560]|uniref:CapA family protein n=1 Tax=Streptomyces sp. NPDC050560 TaxID=3365630 RepID=UPI00379E3990
MAIPPHRPRTSRRALALTAVTALCALAACGAPHRPQQHQRPDSAAGGADRVPKGFTLVATGDVLPHDSVIARARADAGGTGYDFRPMLAGIKPVVSRADLAICHMETVYGADGHYHGYPTFTSPPQIAPALAATGYDSCSTASNHSLDDGPAGITRTLDALDRAGVKHAGSARSAAEASSPTWLHAGSAKVAHLAYTYGTNGIPVPKDKPWLVRLTDRDRVVRDARAARKAGADVVVVSVHWGTEWQDAPDANQLTLARQLTAAAAGDRPAIDLVLGTHAHVPQAYEKVNGTWVVYGMGDQIAGDMINDRNRTDPRGNQGSLARFTFAPPAHAGERWRVSRAESVPTWYDTSTGRVTDLARALRTRPSLKKTYDRIRTVVLSRGAAADGLLVDH